MRGRKPAMLSCSLQHDCKSLSPVADSVAKGKTLLQWKVETRGTAGSEGGGFVRTWAGAAEASPCSGRFPSWTFHCCAGELFQIACTFINCTA